VLDPIAVRGEARVRAQARQPDGRPEPRPLSLAADTEGDLAVAGPERLVGNDARVRVAAPSRRTAGDERVLGLVDEDGERALEQRDIDPLAPGATARAFALVAPAGRATLPREQAREHTDHPEQAADDVAHRDADLHRPAFGLAGDGHEPAHGLDHEVVARLARVGT